jgi:LacI family transcriptional regulator
MSNQRSIAQALGLNQTTVSLALRGHPRIPEETRQLVLDEAERQGYRSNAYVSTLMQHIRSGRSIRDKICIAILADAKSLDDWLTNQVYVEQYNNIQMQAEKLGFYTECFFLRAAGMSPRRIDGILQARGINGLILGAPYRKTTPFSGLDWKSYACVGNGLSWQNCPADLVVNNHLKNVEIAWEVLRSRGYRRIGLCLPLEQFQKEVRTYWAHGYIGCQLFSSQMESLPIMRGNPEEVPFAQFKEWYERWKPDALLCPTEHEMKWISALGLRVPEDIAIACLATTTDESFSGVIEDSAMMGTTLVDLVAGKIIHNEYGRLTTPKVTLVTGHWREGKTVRPATS